MRRHNQRVCHAYRSLSFITFTYYYSTGVVIITTQLHYLAPAVARVSSSFLFKIFFGSCIPTVRCDFDCASICTDICGYNSICIGDLNTPSSVKCECEEGFWSPTADNRNCKRSWKNIFSEHKTHTSMSYRGSSRATVIVLMDHPAERYSTTWQQQERCACLHRCRVQRNNICDDAVQRFVWYRSRPAGHCCCQSYDCNEVSSTEQSQLTALSSHRHCDCD